MSDESFHPDRTTLTLKFANKQSDKTSEQTKQANKTDANNILTKSEKH